EDGEGEEGDQPRGPVARDRLALEEVHRRSDQPKATRGASRSTGTFTSNNSAPPKPVALAVGDAGERSRPVLYSITASLKAWRANEILFSVEVSSSISVAMVSFALSVG